MSDKLNIWCVECWAIISNTHMYIFMKLLITAIFFLGFCPNSMSEILLTISSSMSSFVMIFTFCVEGLTSSIFDKCWISNKKNYKIHSGHLLSWIYPNSKNEICISNKISLSDHLVIEFCEIQYQRSYCLYLAPCQIIIELEIGLAEYLITEWAIKICHPSKNSIAHTQNWHTDGNQQTS